MTTNLTPHFTIAELARSEVATRQGVSNIPDERTLEALVALCENILEPLREHLRSLPGHETKLIRVNSGYRSSEVNKLIGGAKDSQHVKGEAADIEVYGFDNAELARAVIALGLPFDQLILEHYTPGMPNSGWVHVSHKLIGVQRKEVLHATFEKGKRVFRPGLGTA